MTMQRFCCLAVAVAAAVLHSQGRAPAQDGWGDVTGQFVLSGDMPEPVVLIRKGDANVKNSEVCAAVTHYKNDLSIDPETKGIANIFIYMRKADKVHPDLQESEKKEVVFDQKNCRFTPHSLLVRTDQTVVIKSDDPIQHNTHTYPLRNQAYNFILKPNERSGEKIQYPVPEFLPIQVKCDIHPWMMAYWMILDHPYMAVTDENGSFTIERLPAGQNEFRVWHERVGYLDRKFTVTVSDGETTRLDPVEVPVARFSE